MSWATTRRSVALAIALAWPACLGWPGPQGGARGPVPSYAVADLPSAAPAGQLAYVTNETGGAVLAFSDGSDWRRVTDRAVVAE